MAASMASDHQETHVDPALWRAIAGKLLHIPTVNSSVYFFPQGHIEQASTAVSLSSMAVIHSILCRVLNVSFLVDVITDEVFVKFLLQPFKTTTGGGIHGGESIVTGSEFDVVSCSKVLTPSDANNGGGFSVPRICADSIFPPLDFTIDPPVQYLKIEDINGKEYSFRHVYRGTPRRHLFTTGWSRFVNDKVLIGGDAVVFMKDKVTGKLFVGLRRVFKKKKEPASKESLGFVPKAAVPSGKKWFSRSNIGRVPAEKVVEAVERAMSGLAFEVVFYPRPGRPECVVAAEKVEVACGVNWSAGMKVKLAQEMDDGKLSWYNGTVESVVSHSDQGRWMGSPWRRIQVKWEESNILQNMRTVNPWQVEFIDPTPPINATFPLTKKFKGVQNSALLNDEEGDPILLSMDFSSMMGQFTPSLLNSNPFPAGMQGARQNPFIRTNGLPSIINDNNNQANNLDENRDCNIINSSHETSLPESQNNDVGVIFNEQHSCNLTKKDVTSFQLFGTVIQMGQPNNVGSRKNDSSEPRGTRNTEENSSRKARKSSLKKKDAL